MSETLLALIEFVASHPWLIAVIPAVFVGLHLAVVRPWNARTRRRHEDLVAKRAVRDLYVAAHRQVSDSERSE